MGASNRGFDPPPARFGQIAASRGLVFTCLACGRPHGCSRDGALDAWGKRGVIRAVAAAGLRCTGCKRIRPMSVTLSPARAKLGSTEPLDKVVAEIQALRPGRQIS